MKDERGEKEVIQCRKQSRNEMTDREGGRYVKSTYYDRAVIEDNSS